MASSPKEITVEVRWMAAIAKPGDTIIIGRSDKIDQPQAQDIRDKIAEYAPLVNIVIIDQVASMNVYRSHER